MNSATQGSNRNHAMDNSVNTYEGFAPEPLSILSSVAPRYHPPTCRSCLCQMEMHRQLQIHPFGTCRHSLGPIQFSILRIVATLKWTAIEKKVCFRTSSWVTNGLGRLQLASYTTNSIRTHQSIIITFIHRYVVFDGSTYLIHLFRHPTRTFAACPQSPH